MTTRRRYNLKAQDGVSYVELLVVIVIISIVASIAFMQRGSANAQFQRQNVARELKVALERARFDSVKRRADTAATQATVTINANNSFTLRVDKDQNGTLNTADDVTTASPANIVIAGSGGITLPVTVIYNQRGEASIVGGGTPLFLVCNGTCPTFPGNSGNANIVLVTPTGTVNLLPGGSSLPSFTAPGVTALDGTLGINPLVKVP